MAITGSDIKRGMILKIDEGNYRVLETEHVKPGKGGAFVQTKLRDLDGGSLVNQRFRSSEKVETAWEESREAEYLYEDGGAYWFMNTDTYEQFSLSEEIVGEAMPYVKHNETIRITYVDDEPLDVDLPASVVLEVAETEPAVRGDTATSVTKTATCETGLDVKVPLHIDEGEEIKVDTRTGEFIERHHE